MFSENQKNNQSIHLEALLKVGSDRHGSLFILDDLIFSENAQSLFSIPTGTMNVRFENSFTSNLPTNNNSLLQGVSLNSLLRSLFLVCSYRKNINTNQMKEQYHFLTSLLLPGGIDCWETLIESTFITITSFSTIQELMNRILTLTTTIKSSNVQEFQSGSLTSTLNLLDNDIIGILLEGSILFLMHWLTNYDMYLADLHLSQIRACINTVSSILKLRINSINKIFCRINEICIELEEFVTSLVLNRGKGSNTIFTQVGISSDTHFGIWDGTDNKNEIIAKNKAKLDMAPKVKIDVFGGDSLWDDYDEDDDEDENKNDKINNNDKYRDLSCNKSKCPIPRIEQGFSLLHQDPRNLSIWDFDQLELARQWTIIDYSLFVSIPLNSYLGSKAAWSLPRGKRGVPQLRAVIDRFNATSLWATSSILDLATPELRALMYVSLVEFALKLHSLGNYCSLMAIITALQQGSISRLSKTLYLINKQDKDKLTKLHKLMSGNKNYILYREEIVEKISNFSYDIRGNVIEKDNIKMDENFQCVVPHLAAHLGEMATIIEGNPDYLPDAPHLINLSKIRLITRAINTIAIMRQQKYNFIPIRLISIVINRELKQFVYLNGIESTNKGRLLYDKSVKLEPDDENDSDECSESESSGSDISSYDSSIDNKPNLLQKMGKMLSFNRSNNIL